MKVLQLLSDWKWTGPCEPVTSLCEALAREGLDVTLAYRKTPEHRLNERTMEKEARKRALKSYEGFRLNRYFSFKDWGHDIIHIKRFVEKEGIDIVHANLSHDHFLALLSLSFSGKRPVIVRTDHKWDGIPADPFMRWALSKTHGLVSYSSKIIEQDMRVFGFDREKTCVIRPAIQPFAGETEDRRSEFAIAPEDKVIGFAGRLKIDRGYDVILKAFRIARNRVGNVKLLIIGVGGSEDERTIRGLIDGLGLEDDVIRAGYRTKDYFSVMSAFDVFVIMRAGTDGTARALREAMSLGIPSIVSDQGMLPELVDDGVNGFVVKLDENALAEKMIELVLNDGKRRAFGEKAQEKARTRWTYREQASTLMRFYDKLLQSRK